MIPLAKPFFDDEEQKEIEKVLDSGWVSQGPKTKEFEDLIAQYLNVKYAVAVNNCTAALHLANLSIGIKQGDEVLVSDYTFPATGHSVLYCGAKPVFLDIDPKTYNLNPTLVEDMISEKTKAIIPVHTFGQTVDMAPILKISKKYGIPVIEDAACALGAKYNNRYAGTMGDIGCFSFHARKGITTGEGGMIVTDDKEIAEKVRFLSVFGMKTAWEREISSKFIVPVFSALGYNYKMSDITAAVGVAQQKKIDRIIKRKRELAKIWDEELEKIDSIESPFVSHENFHIYQSYVTVVGKKMNRDKIIEKMRSYKIQTQIGTYSCHIQPLYKADKQCPVSLDISMRALALPLFFQLKEEQIEMMASRLKYVLRECECH